MKKKAVLFDLDNTLYDYDICHEKALKAVYQEIKQILNMNYKEFIKLYNLSKNEIQRELSGTASSHNRILYFQRIIERTHQTIESSIILKLYDTYWNTFLKHMRLRKGALDLLKIIKKKGIQIAIVSDLTTYIQLRKLCALRINNYVDFLVTSEEAGSEKPHKIMFLAALNKLNMLPKDVLMVGDNQIADIEGANAVTIDTVLLRTPRLRVAKEGYRKPDYIIRELPELLGILDKIEKGIDARFKVCI